ncbi:receptor-like protein 41 isoform X2 [Corylus avellana]|uniref:receptor-like protein 41 isoform X2 n=1 Tax=Corylus avellana TaxID=13451 RepID=UPI00286A20AA|nr:receptor-like protein 41 isoform X2 [Corylus avellana]
MRIPFTSRVFLIPICSIFLSFCIFVVAGQCLDSQRSLLLQLKNNLTFNTAMSKKLARWNQSADCCSWEGVNCSEESVIGLDLTNEAISGGRDNLSSLFNLQNLQNLSLAYNRFNGTIPSELQKLTNLSYLNLSNAGFAGQIPIEISRLTRLVSLDLSAVYFPETIPLKLENPNLKMLVQNLPELIELHLDGVNISARGNEWCQALSSSLQNLRVLSLSNCYLSGPINSSLLKLQNLSIIRLDNNKLSTPVPDFFANFRQLTSLRLSFSGLTGTFPGKIFQVQTLEILDLSNNVLLHGRLPDFPQNGSLRTLVLSNTNFSGTLSDSISNLIKLSRIDLSNCNFSGSLPHSLAKLTQLLYLDMSSNSFTGPIPSFSMARKLIQINLSHNDLIGQINSTHWEELRYLVSLELHYNSLNGSIPVSLFSLPKLQKLQLSNNQFSGQLNLSNISSYLLDTLDLSSNNLDGPIPTPVFELQGLKLLSLSSNNFNGSLQLNVIQRLRNLSSLDLSYNSLLVEYNGNDGINSSLSSFPNITTLKLASSKLKKFPDFLKNQSKLTYLDLSYNQIDGNIPNWLGELRNLTYINISFNRLVTLERPFSSLSFLNVLDLSSNQLQGQLPVLPQSATYLDFSRNNFSSAIPASIGGSLNLAYFFSLSSNKFSGSIPESICNAAYLQVLDLSNNLFSGKIPQCLIEMSGTLGVLNLRRNNLTGSIPNSFQGNCSLQTLDFSGNLIGGSLPKSLASCTKLEVLNIGNNRIEDTFPCYLKNVFMLRVLVLRSNNFGGSVSCSESNATWPMLQIVDVASNNFTGKLSKISNWMAMMDDENEAQSELNHLQYLQYEFLSLNQFYYQDTITVTIKGLDVELVKILTLFTTIDVSCNNIEGPIPEEFGGLRSLHMLNLSHNTLTGQIPPSLGNLTRLESLDLSKNKLTGEIPVELAAGLIFLSVLDLSFNQLVGQIPVIKQFSTFSEASYAGNSGLCGFPLKAKCTHAEPTSPPAPAPKSLDTASTMLIGFDWQFIVTGLGFGVGAAVVVALLMFWEKGRRWYDESIDKILLVVLPMMGLSYTGCNNRAEAEEDAEDENTEDYDDDDEDETEDEEFRGRYCVFCSKLDISRKRAIHDPHCTGSSTQERRDENIC